MKWWSIGYFKLREVDIYLFRLVYNDAHTYSCSWDPIDSNKIRRTLLIVLSKNFGFQTRQVLMCLACWWAVFASSSLSQICNTGNVSDCPDKMGSILTWWPLDFSADQGSLGVPPGPRSLMSTSYTCPSSRAFISSLYVYQGDTCVVLHFFLLDRNSL